MRMEGELGWNLAKTLYISILTNITRGNIEYLLFIKKLGVDYAKMLFMRVECYCMRREGELGWNLAKTLYASYALKHWTNSTKSLLNEHFIWVDIFIQNNAFYTNWDVCDVTGYIWCERILVLLRVKSWVVKQIVIF